MKLDLNTLKTEVPEYMEAEGFVVFHGYSRLADADSFVAWDTDLRPDYRPFLSAAKNAGVKLIVYHCREFSAAYLEDATERLEASELSLEERHGAERRLRALKAYEGFTCTLELSFDYQGRVYVFSLRAEWYDDYLDLLEDLDGTETGEQQAEDDPMGGFYSRN
jgi:hypothetical protein